MSKIKNNILWILCVINYVAYGWSLSTLLMPDFKNELIDKIHYFGSGIAIWYSVIISVFVAVISIAVLIYKWVKNKKVRINEVILLVLFVFGLFMVGCYYWLTYRYFHGH